MSKKAKNLIQKKKEELSSVGWLWQSSLDRIIKLAKDGQSDALLSEIRNFSHLDQRIEKIKTVIRRQELSLTPEYQKLDSKSVAVALLKGDTTEEVLEFYRRNKHNVNHQMLLMGAPLNKKFTKETK